MNIKTMWRTFERADAQDRTEEEGKNDSAVIYQYSLSPAKAVHDIVDDDESTSHSVLNARSHLVVANGQ